jgi:hypothetical protein
MPRQLRYAVVVGVILVLAAGLLAPAVVRVREAASRTTCQCHIGCLAHAIHSYSASNTDRLPAGTITYPDLPPERRLSWYVPVFPFIEESQVYKQFDQTAAADDDRNRDATSHRFRNFVCPSSGEYDRDDKVWKSPTPVTHYVGVAGVGADAATLPVGHPRAGAFGYDRRAALPDDFPDGLSNTLFLIETGLNPGHWAFGGTATVRAVEPGAAPYIGRGRPFGGFHANGWSLWRETESVCNAVMADASLRTLRSTVAPEVLEALATAGGKEPLPADWRFGLTAPPGRAPGSRPRTAAPGGSPASAA